MDISTVAPWLTTLLSILSIKCPEGNFQATPGKTPEECRRCTVCPKGWGEIVPCTHAHDRQCEPCPNGTFSLEDVGDSDLKVCEPCAECQPLKRKELVTCCSTHDAKCGGCEDGFYFNEEYYQCLPQVQLTSVSPSSDRPSVRSVNLNEAAAAPEMMSTSEFNSLSPMKRNVWTTPYIVFAVILILILIIVGVLSIVYILKTKIFSSGYSKSCWTLQERSIESDPMLNLTEQESTEHETRIAEIAA